MTDDDVTARLAEALRAANAPLTSADLAELTGLRLDVIEHALWGAPERFAWQPGHRWANATKKQAVFHRPAGPTATDSQPFPFRPSGAQPLRARTLANGLEVIIVSRALDSLAFFTVRSRGNALEIVLNSAHPLFGNGSMPFTGAPDRMFSVLEAMLEAWAIIEDGAPSDAERRMIEHLRHRWGERALELLEQQT